MAYLPDLYKKNTAQLVTNTFLGLNQHALIADGEWAREMNLSTREFPALCPRGSRIRHYRTPEGAGRGIIARDKLYWVEGTKVYYDYEEVTGLTVSDDGLATPKQLVGFGSYVVIFPDKKYFNMLDLTEYGSLEDEYTSSGTVRYILCRLDGSDYENVTRSKKEPANPENGDYWIDTKESNHQLRVYSEAMKSWQVIQTVYTRIQAAGIDGHFKTGDTITLEGMESDDSVAGPQLAAMNGSQHVYAHGEGWITILGLLSKATTQKDGTSFTASRRVPDMEYVVEHDNRLWGCHYGVDPDGKTLNEIYASKQGDMKNWRVYQGTSMDSYTVSIGSPGPWTGAIVYNGNPLFFKEGCVHKIYGTMPSNYQAVQNVLHGVHRHAGGSLCQAGGYLMYLSSRGVEMYDGNMPTCVSDQLNLRIKYPIVLNAVAGSDGSKYYLNIGDSELDTELLVYDIQRNVWHAESCDGRIVGFAYCYGGMAVEDVFEAGLYAQFRDGNIYRMDKNTPASTEAVEWMAESGILGWDMVDQKYITRYNIRAQMAQGASLKVKIQYDSEGEWETKLDMSNATEGTRTLLMPVYPRRCDHMRLRLEGTGDVKIMSISRILSGGGDGQHG